jgi:VTC domain
MTELEGVMTGLDPIGLDELDEQAKLRKRVDNKYVVPDEVAAATVERLADSYRALEIDSQRKFTYESVYFDTPDLRCFVDHVEGGRPRFKVRSRLYVETDACFFEIKVKRADDETVKRQQPYEQVHHGEITDEARSFVGDALAELADEPLPADLAPSISTTYRRLTVAAREGGERATLDLAVELRSMDDREVALRDGVVLIETKTSDGESRIDEELRSAGCEAISISKYRLGVGLLLADDPEAAHAQTLRSYFV